MIEEFAVTAATVKRLVDRHEPLFFVHVRHSWEWDVAVMKARGALRISDDEVAQHLDEIPRGRTVIVYANLPGDEPSFDAARRLQQQGLNDVHPLIGGFKAYLTRGLPVEEVGEGSQARKIMLL